MNKNQLKIFKKFSTHLGDVKVDYYCEVVDQRKQNEALRREAKFVGGERRRGVGPQFYQQFYSLSFTIT